MKIKKTILITLLAFLVVGFIGVIIFDQWLKGLGKAFGEKCKTVDTIAVKEYKILKSQCLGWAGPHYYHLDLFKNGEELSDSFFNDDSCSIYFVQGDDRLLILDTCNQQVSTQYPQKTELKIVEIDSIIVTKKDNLTQKKLSTQEIADFVTRWNNSKPDGPRRIDVEPYPAPKYSIDAYGNGQVRKFRTTHMSVQETTNIWDYSFLEGKEDRTTQKLDQVFKMN